MNDPGNLLILDDLEVIDPVHAISLTHYTRIFRLCVREFWRLRDETHTYFDTKHAVLLLRIVESFRLSSFFVLVGPTLLVGSVLGLSFGVVGNLVEFHSLLLVLC